MYAFPTLLLSYLRPIMTSFDCGTWKPLAAEKISRSTKVIGIALLIPELLVLDKQRQLEECFFAIISFSFLLYLNWNFSSQNIPYYFFSPLLIC